MNVRPEAYQHLADDVAFLLPRLRAATGHLARRGLVIAVKEAALDREWERDAGYPRLAQQVLVQWDTDRQIVFDFGLTFWSEAEPQHVGGLTVEVGNQWYYVGDWDQPDVLERKLSEWFAVE